MAAVPIHLDPTRPCDARIVKAVILALFLPSGRTLAGWLAGDGVHATPGGYRARAQMYADAARSAGA
jgi:lysophospholipase L1-like esterase